MREKVTVGQHSKRRFLQGGIISSMPDEEKLPCSEKIAFETRVAAETTATTSEYWYGSRPHAYKCHHCHLWHLSSS